MYLELQKKRFPEKKNQNKGMDKLGPGSYDAGKNKNIGYKNSSFL